MTITMDIAPELEQLAKEKAKAKGIPLEDYLPLLLAQAAQQVVWDEDDDASLATILGSEATMRRLWDTPEEDEAWKHLQGD